MTYIPWPETGCTLAEARSRVGGTFMHKDQEFWSQAGDILPDGSSSGEVVSAPPVRDLDGVCLNHLCHGSLVATAQTAACSERRLIDPGLWPNLRIDWSQSAAVENGAAEPTYLGIAIFPPLLAPNRIDLLAGRALAEVCTEYLFNDPEVATLMGEAVRRSPDFGRVSKDRRCHIHGVPEWPLAYDRWCYLSTVHPDPDLRSVFDGDDPDSIEVVIAAEAVKHRYRLLISMLRTRELLGRGLPAAPGQRDEVLVSVWSHEDFHLDMTKGDIRQDNPESTDRYDRLITRWYGVVVERADARRSFALHVKPLMNEPVRSSAIKHDTPRRPTRTVARSRVETTGTARRECVKWLVGLMHKSPNVRTHSIAELWAEAQRSWPGTLSHRKFQEARSEAIRTSGASVWAAAGAPSKSKRSQSPR